MLENAGGVVFGISDLLNLEESVALLTTVKGVGFDSLQKVRARLVAMAPAHIAIVDIPERLPQQRPPPYALQSAGRRAV